ncbi:ester cyclase [Actinoplanes sp. NPDC049118]|uniref:ester cyclase n=1 Tax=Actinoplanes sp. NPDC049118 TaxID=3155769 RepID=UPI0033CC28C8
MTTENTNVTDLDAVARMGFAALARRDLSRPELIWADDAVDHFLPVGDAVGRDEIVAFFAEMFAALPDFTIEVERTVAAAPFVVVQWRGTGTFTGGRFQGIRATGRKIDFRGCDVVEIREGLVVDNTVYWDNAGFARQVGLLPPLGSSTDRLLLRAFNASTWVRTVGRRKGRKHHA